MSPLSGRTVVLGVCGSIAAYKAAEICRQLCDAGAHVIPVMTDAACRFLGPPTLSALASEPVRTSLWVDETPPWRGADHLAVHLGLARSADVVLVAPATARLMGAYAAGIADDLLTSILLATRAPVVLAPAMHTEMWEHPATVANVELLRSRRVVMVEPGFGRLAGGDVGSGRLADPPDILAAMEAVLAPSSSPSVTDDLVGRRVLVTAGGTREPIDAVRYLGNRSSGRQGWAIAVEAARRGAQVTLVTTVADPTGAQSTQPGPGSSSIEVVPVQTAAQMEEAVLARSSEADVVVLAAAVADFRPRLVANRPVSQSKLRRDHGVPEVLLEATTDIAAEVGRRGRPDQVLVGFALGSGSLDALAAEASAKLAVKKLNLVVGNAISALDSPTNQAVIVDDQKTVQTTPQLSKEDLAALLLDRVSRRLSPTGETT